MRKEHMNIHYSRVIAIAFDDVTADDVIGESGSALLLLPPLLLGVVEQEHVNVHHIGTGQSCGH